MEHDERTPRAMKASTKAAVLAGLTLAFLAYIGNFHFVYGENITLRKVPKVSWSLSEMVINADAVRELPVFVLRINYPLFIQAGDPLK